jgi:hypothetical protein
MSGRLGIIFRSWCAILLTAAAGCSVSHVEMADGQHRSRDIEISVGKVRIGQDCRLAGDIRLRAGEVEVQDRSIVIGGITVQAGNVDLGPDVQVRAVSVVDGTVRLGQGARLQRGASVVNGLLAVQGAQVSGPVRLTRGRLEIDSGSQLTGGVQVENIGRLPQDSTYVVIHAGAHLRGEIRTRGHVRLLVHAALDTTGVQFVGNRPEFIR